MSVNGSIAKCEGMYGRTNIIPHTPSIIRLSSAFVPHLRELGRDSDGLTAGSAARSSFFAGRCVISRC